MSAYRYPVMGVDVTATPAASPHPPTRPWPARAVVCRKLGKGVGYTSPACRQITTPPLDERNRREKRGAAMEAIRPRTAERYRDVGGTAPYRTPPPPKHPPVRPAGRSVAERIVGASVQGPRLVDAAAIPQRPQTATPTPRVVQRGGAWRRVPPRSTTRAESRSGRPGIATASPRRGAHRDLPRRPHSAMDGRPTYTAAVAAASPSPERSGGGGGGGGGGGYASPPRPSSPRAGSRRRGRKSARLSRAAEEALEDEVDKCSKEYLLDSQIARRNINLSCETVRTIIEEFEERVSFDDALARANLEVPAATYVTAPAQDMAAVVSAAMGGLAGIDGLSSCTPLGPSIPLNPGTPALSHDGSPGLQPLPSATLTHTSMPPRRVSAAPFKDDTSTSNFAIDASTDQQAQAKDLYKAMTALSTYTDSAYRRAKELCDAYVPPANASASNAAAQHYLQMDADVRTAEGAVRHVDTMWASFKDLTSRVLQHDENMSSVKHKLGHGDERVRKAILTARAERAKTMQLRCAMRWQRMCLRGQRARLRDARDGVGVDTTAQQYTAEGAVLFCSLEHAARLAAVHPATLALWDDVLRRCCDFVGGALTVGAGAAQGRGYALVVFDTPQDAIGFAMKLQHALLAVNWPDEVVGHALCPTRYADDVTSASPTSQRAQYFMKYGAAELESAKAQLDVEQLVHIAQGIGSRRAGQGHADTVRGPAVFRGPRVRMSVHSGVILLDDGYYGRTMMTASLLCGKARPGEVVVSDAVHRAVHDWLQVERIHSTSAVLPQLEDNMRHHWVMQGREVSYNVFERGEQAHSLYTQQLISRMALFEPQRAIFHHERIAYNPHWWLRYCNYPVVSEEECTRRRAPARRVTARFEGFERMLMATHDADAHRE